MCRNRAETYVSLPTHQAVMFMNSNKSQKNISRILQENREMCSSAGVALMQDCIVNKGPDRDIDREAVNMLIALLLTGKYDTVAVGRLTDITEDESDLEEFMREAAKIGVGFFELASMQYYMHPEMRIYYESAMPIWDGGVGC